MEDTVAAVLKHHRGLKVLQENRQVVTNELTRARAGWGPRVELSGRTGMSKLSDSTTRGLNAADRMYDANSINLTVIQPLWDGRATRSRVDTAEATVESVDHRLFDNATTLALDGIIAHIDLLRRREILRLSYANVKQHEDILVSSKTRTDLGADTMAEVTQTEGRLARAQATVAEARAALREAENTYRRLTGTPVPEELTPITLPGDMYTSMEMPLEVAQEENPKVLAYKMDVQASAGEVGLAKSTYHPTINLEAGPSYSDRGGGGSQWTSSFEVMATMRWNLYNSGADEAEVRAAKARVRQSRETMFDFMDTLTLEVQDTWSAYLSANEQLDHYLAAIGYNTSTRDAYLEQFTLGRRSLLDVLDAESELFNSATQVATAQGNVLVTGWRLYALAGVLLKEIKVDVEALYPPPSNED